MFILASQIVILLRTLATLRYENYVRKSPLTSKYTFKVISPLSHEFETVKKKINLWLERANLLRHKDQASVRFQEMFPDPYFNWHNLKQVDIYHNGDYAFTRVVPFTGQKDLYPHPSAKILFVIYKDFTRGNDTLLRHQMGLSSHSKTQHLTTAEIWYVLGMCSSSSFSCNNSVLGSDPNSAMMPPKYQQVGDSHVGKNSDRVEWIVERLS